MNIYETSNERLAICGKCKHFKKKSRTCGTPIVGQTITYRKKKYKLCGCFMDAKSLLKFARCPLGKWVNPPITETEYKEMKQLLSKTVDKITAEQNKQIAILHRKYYNSNATPNNCVPCVVKNINDLKEVIAQYEHE